VLGFAAELGSCVNSGSAPVTPIYSSAARSVQVKISVDKFVWQSGAQSGLSASVSPFVTVAQITSVGQR